MAETLIYHLNSADRLEHFSILSDEQSSVVRRFLDYVAADPQCDCMDVQAGLEGYWKKFALMNVPETAGRAQDALDDIEVFITRAQAKDR